MRTVEQYQALANGLSTEQVAERLGVSIRHVLGLIADEALRAVDCSRKGASVPYWRVPEDDLAAFIEARQNRPKGEAA